jgi:hypothetical protein
MTPVNSALDAYTAGKLPDIGAKTANSISVIAAIVKIFSFIYLTIIKSSSIFIVNVLYIIL